MVVQIIIIFQLDGFCRSNFLCPAIGCGIGEDKLDLRGQLHILSIFVFVRQLRGIRTQQNRLNSNLRTVHIPSPRTSLPRLRILNGSCHLQCLSRLQLGRGLECGCRPGDAVIREIFQGQLRGPGYFLRSAILGCVCQTIRDGTGLRHTVVIIIAIHQRCRTASQGQGARSHLLSVHIPVAHAGLSHLRCINLCCGNQRLSCFQNLRQHHLDLRVSQTQIREGLQCNGCRGRFGKGVPIIVFIA